MVSSGIYPSIYLSGCGWVKGEEEGGPPLETAGAQDGLPLFYSRYGRLARIGTDGWVTRFLQSFPLASIDRWAQDGAEQDRKPIRDYRAPGSVHGRSLL